MPKIATYGEQQVSTQVVQGARAGNVAPGAFSQPLLEGGAQLAKGFAEMQMTLDNTAAEEAVTKFEREKNNLFFNPDTGYFNTAGRTAYDEAPNVNKQLEDLKRTYLEGLKSPGAQEVFARIADKHITSSQVDIDRHAAKNIKAWEVATINASVENTIENASLYWNDGEKTKVQNALGRQSIIDAAELEGITGEALKERLQTYDSSFYAAGVESATATSSTDGEELLDKHRGKIEGPQLLKLQKIIDSKKNAEKTASDSQYAVLEANKMLDQYETRTEINEALRTIEDPALQQATRKEVMHQFNQREQAKAEERTATFEAAENHLLDGGSLEVFKSQNPDAWEKLSPKQKQSLIEGKAVTTDFNLYYNLMNMSQAEKAKLSVDDYMNQLAKPEREKLNNEIKRARSGSALGFSSRDAETVSAVEQIIGKKRSDWSIKQKEEANAYYRVLNAENQARAKDLGRDLTSEEYSTMLNDMSRKVVKENGFLGFIDTEMSLEDVPREDIPVYSSFLRSRGETVTADNLVRVMSGIDDNRGALERELTKRGIPVNTTTLVNLYDQATK